MQRDKYKEIISLIKEASDIAKTFGIHNLVQPGLIKEMIIADALGHELIPSKRQPDARSFDNPDELYEYLSCVEGGRGQIDRMFKFPESNRQTSLNRIRRNAKIYLAIFCNENQLEIKRIYEIDPEIVIVEAERQLDISRNNISHIGISESWAIINGRIVFPR